MLQLELGLGTGDRYYIPFFFFFSCYRDKHLCLALLSVRNRLGLANGWGLPHVHVFLILLLVSCIPTLTLPPSSPTAFSQ